MLNMAAVFLVTIFPHSVDLTFRPLGVAGFVELASEPSSVASLHGLHFLPFSQGDFQMFLLKALCSLITFSKIFARHSWEQFLECRTAVQNGDSAVSLHRSSQEAMMREEEGEALPWSSFSELGSRGCVCKLGFCGELCCFMAQARLDLSCTLRR